MTDAVNRLEVVMVGVVEIVLIVIVMVIVAAMILATVVVVLILAIAGARQYGRFFGFHIFRLGKDGL